MKKRSSSPFKNIKTANKLIQIAQMVALIVAAIMLARAFKFLFVFWN